MDATRPRIIEIVPKPSSKEDIEDVIQKKLARVGNSLVWGCVGTTAIWLLVSAGLGVLVLVWVCHAIVRSW